MSSSDQQWLLRVEAVNLGAFIYDSGDLSTIRGAGLLVLSLHLHLTDWDVEQQTFGYAGLLKYGHASQPAPDPLAVHLRWHVPVGQGPNRTSIELDLISAGASVVIYRFHAQPEQAERLQHLVESYLSTHPRLRFATFAVATGPLCKVDEKNDDFFVSSEQILRALRKRQLQTLTVGPGWTDNGTVRNSAHHDRFCDIDGKRAAVCSLNNPEDSRNPGSAYARAVDKNFASQATEVRRSFGRLARIRLYHMVGSVDSHTKDNPTGDDLILKHFRPTWELQDIAARGVRRVPTDQRLNPDPLDQLAGKIAVLYIDGNKFASQIRQHAITPESAQHVDRRILSLRRQLLRELVRHIQSDSRPYWRVRTQQTAGHAVDQQFRIETLMWGGDELIWVVPAWCGLEVVRFFFEHTRNWSLCDSDVRNSSRLTHAAGLVFCSHKSPIQSVVSLAKQLAEDAKQTLASRHIDTDDLSFYQQPSANCLAYQVLESFDHIGGDFDRARARHRFPSMSAAESVLSCDQLQQLINHINQLKHQVRLPGTRRHQIGRLLRSSDLAATLSAEALAETNYGRLIQRIAQTVQSQGLTEQQVSVLLNSQIGGTTPLSPSARWYHIVELWDYLGSLDQTVIQQYCSQVNSTVECQQ